MPMGKGTYGSQRGRPPKKQMLTAKQKTLPAALRKKLWLQRRKNKWLQRLRKLQLGLAKRARIPKVDSTPKVAPLTKAALLKRQLSLETILEEQVFSQGWATCVVQSEIVRAAPRASFSHCARGVPLQKLTRRRKRRLYLNVIKLKRRKRDG